MKTLSVKFSFAGFNFPRYVPEIRKSAYDKRTSRSTYYHAPEPMVGGKSHPGDSFYLGDMGGPSRWVWADEAGGVRINHTGWYTDEDGDSEKMRGIVVRLPHGKFLAGWSMGEGMSSSVEGDIYNDETEAAYAADSIAENAAEREREYQEEERVRIKEEEARQEECEGGDAEEIDGY